MLIVLILSKISKKKNNPFLSLRFIQKFAYNSYFCFFITYIFIVMFVCSRCGNSNPLYIGYKKDKPYCRKCITFTGKSACENKDKSHCVILNLNYDLSDEQVKASNKIVKAISSGRNVLISAVCGAGKTELTFAVIKDALIKGQQVGFVIPRKDVVIEIYKRLSEVFPRNSVIVVYGGHNENLQGELIVLTSHQLYRYENYFDLLIMDEIDAFPYHGDEVLRAMFIRSCRGNYVIMSATLSTSQINAFAKEGGECISINTRYHGFPLPVPKIVIMIGILKHFFLIRKIRELIKERKPIFIFVPTIAKCEDLFAFLSKWVRKGNYVHSKRKNREEVINDFRQSKYSYLVTTAVLERGVTLKNLQVIVFECDHAIYTASALVQIAGRVGRKKDAPQGEVVFLSDRRTAAMDEAIREIETKNKSLSSMLLRY